MDELQIKLWWNQEGQKLIKAKRISIMINNVEMAKTLRDIKLTKKKAKKAINEVCQNINI